MTHKALSKFWFILTLGFWVPKAAVALELSYSGRIVDESGAPSRGPLDLTLRFFGSETGSDQLGQALTFSQVPLIRLAISTLVASSILRAA